MNYLVTSFIAIVQRVSNNRAVCDEDTTIGELLGNSDFDPLDFELAICCFEATHRMEFNDPGDDCDKLTITEFVEKFVEVPPHAGPLFVTNRFLLFKDSLVEVITQTEE